MRDWRKVYGRKLTESDRLAERSFEERWLWLLYTVAQDDEGKYPYTRVKLLSLTVGTGWSWADCQRLTTGMSVVDLVSISDGFVHIANGVEFNGQLRGDRQRFVYSAPLPSAVDHRDTSGEPVVDLATRALEESREEESRREREKSPARAREHQPITEDFIEVVVLEYQDRLGGAAAVRECIAEARNHKAMDKRRDKRQYLRTWLNNEIKYHRTNGRRQVATGDEITASWASALGGNDDTEE
jgi:hypothetical protein